MFTARLIYVNERWACAYLFFYIIMYTYILLFIRLANIVVLSLFDGKILIFFSFCRDSTFIQQKSTRVIQKIVLTLQP